MSDDAERWKEKYLKGIEQQDRLEKLWQARLDLLRRGLVRSSLAAEGTDRAVDECMKEMREIVRKDDMDAGLAGLIPRLEKAVLDSEHRREVRIGQIGTALTALVTQLQALPLPREVRKPLKRLAKGLEARASQARELPLLLSELSALQGKALDAQEKTEEQPRPGLFQRLFGSHETAGDEHAAHPAAENPPVHPVPPAAAVTPEAFPAPADPLQPVETPLASRVVEAEPAAPVTAPIEPEAAVPALIPDEDEIEAKAAEHVVDTQVIPEIQPAPAVSTDPVATAPVASPPVAAALEADTVSEPAAGERLPEQDPLEIPLTPVPPVPLEQVSAPQSPVEEERAAEELEPEEQKGEEGEEGEYALPNSPEPSYSTVATHIEETLLGLLGDLNLPERHQPQADSMRKRLEHGLNWYELLPILEDFAVLMLAISDSGQHEFEAYLKQLNQRLEYFQSSLQVVSDDHAASHSSARDFDSRLREHVDDLQSSVQDASDLNSLKRVLENRLEGLLGAMDAHQHQRDEREREVAERLQSLAGRVASMEQEALGFRANLEEQRRKALIDPLTGLPNRAAWGERLEHEVAQWQQNRNSLLLCIMDLDHFKRINDTYGHLAGDKVLKIVAKEMYKRQRSRDFLARFGGEEFVLLLPATVVDTGLQLLNELRMAVERCPFHFKGEPVTITVSIGMTVMRAGERSDVALKRADQALYRAKENGRNRIEQG